MNKTLHNYQLDAIEHMIKHDRSYLLIDLGLGKTVIAMTAVSRFLKLEPKMKTLVVAPKLVAETVWPHEAEGWPHLQNLRVVHAGGTAAQRIKIIESHNYDIVTLSFNNLPWFVKRYIKRWYWNTVIIDECSRLKNPTGMWTRAAKSFSPYVPRIYGMTATPVSNSWQDIWSQAFLIDGGDALGHTVTRFRETFMTKTYFDWKIRPGAEKTIMELIEPFTYRLDRKVHLPIDEPTVRDSYIYLPDTLKRDYDTFEKEFFLELESGEVEALNAAAATTKLRQIANGTVYADTGPEELHSLKLNLLEEIIEEAGDNPVLVGYEFVSDRDRILARFPQAEPLTSARIPAWNAKKVPLMIAHPQSCSHGLNLQGGGSILVFYTLPWSLDSYEQMIGRLARQGQTEPVLVYRLITAGTVEEAVVLRLEKKGDVQMSALEALAEYKRHKKAGTQGKVPAF